MSKEILVNVEEEEHRVAILEDGELVEIKIAREERLVGSIYKGRITNILSGMQAAFVNIGLDKNAFLCFEDAIKIVSQDEEEDLEELKHFNIKDILHEQQELLVQIIKAPIGKKGARVSTQITLPGRYLVLLPGADYIGVSRRIENENERERLRELITKLKPESFGIIVRTVAEGKGEKEFSKDLNFLLGLWQDIKMKAQSVSSPAVIYQEMSLIYRTIRDDFTPEVEKLIIDSRKEYEKALELVKAISPSLIDRVKYYKSNYPLFEFYGIEKKIENALKSKVWLENGGYIIINPTEALTVIDVNTGSFVGGENLEETIFYTNLEAAKVIAREVRLRDISGIIIIDFIDMELAHHRREVIKTLEEAVKKDRVKTVVLGMTQLGLVEMTRKRICDNISQILQENCPYCGGEGVVASPRTIAFKLLRELRGKMVNNKTDAVLIEAHPIVTNIILGWEGEKILQLEHEFNKTIFISVNSRFHISKYKFHFTPKNKLFNIYPPFKEKEVLTVEIKDASYANFQNGISWEGGKILEIRRAGNLIGKKVKVQVIKAYTFMGIANLQ